ncbi:unnamed protein product [Amoebophrya sp. A120]|nr:unnamed protein product [Amoebophrya sp. A120]|eukprot:GSA120T00015615001.1
MSNNERTLLKSISPSIDSKVEIYCKCIQYLNLMYFPGPGTGDRYVPLSTLLTPLYNRKQHTARSMDTLQFNSNFLQHRQANGNENGDALSSLSSDRFALAVGLL